MTVIILEHCIGEKTECDQKEEDESYISAC